VADLVDRPKLKISPAILIGQRLIHLYRVQSAGAATTPEPQLEKIAIISSGGLYRHCY
jgi:hypothetical protein